jgi:hypothetical protein
MMGANRFIVIFMIVLSSNVCYAEAVYLECVIEPKANAVNKSPMTFSVKIDEASGKITHTRKDKSAFNTEGFFSPNEIYYKHIDRDPYTESTEQFTIDRSNLTVRSTLVVIVDRKKPDPITIENKGKCDIVPLTKKKI